MSNDHLPLRNYDDLTQAQILTALDAYASYSGTYRLDVLRAYEVAHSNRSAILTKIDALIVAAPTPPPSTVPTYADLAAEQSARVAGDIPRPLSLELLEWFGHSFSFGYGLQREQSGYVDKLAHALGAHRRNNRGWSGSVACWPQAGAVGDGGVEWMLNQLMRPGLIVDVGLNVPDPIAAPYTSRSQIVGFNYGTNDMSKLGGAKYRPFIEAMRTMMAHACAAAIWEAETGKPGSGAWAWTGTWTNGGAGNAYRSSSTLGDKGVLTLPADYPGNRVISITVAVVPGSSSYTQTFGIKIDGVAKPDWAIDSWSVTDSVNGKYNLVTLRLDPATYTALQAAGSHTIEISYKASSITPGPVYIDRAIMEADPLDGPIMPVLSLNRSPVTPDAGDASVVAWNAQLAALIAEFPNRAILVDIDAALNKNPLLFIADNIHPNARGHAVMAEAIRTAIISSGLLTPRVLTRAQVDPTSFFEPVGLAGGRQPFQNARTNLLAGWTPFGYHHHLDGTLELRGTTTGGSSAAAVVTTLPVGRRPRYNVNFPMTRYDGTKAAPDVAQINAAGQLIPTVGSTTYMSFDGVRVGSIL